MTRCKWLAAVCDVCRSRIWVLTQFGVNGYIILDYCGECNHIQKNTGVWGSE